MADFIVYYGMADYVDTSVDWGVAYMADLIVFDGFGDYVDISVD